MMFILCLLSVVLAGEPHGLHVEDDEGWNYWSPVKTKHIHPRIWERGLPGNEHEDKWLFRSASSYAAMHRHGNYDMLY